MTSPRRFESDLPALLADLYLAGTPDYRDDLVRQTSRMRQRPAWTFPERWIPVELVTTRVPTTRMPWRQLGVLALIALLLAAALAVYIGTRPQRLPPPFGVAGNGLIAYSSNGDIVVAERTGANAQQLTSGPESDSDPLFSPDGRRIAFLRSTRAPGYQLMVVSLAGGRPMTVSTKPLASGDAFEWAPDSDWILLGTSDKQLLRLDAVEHREPVIVATDAVAFPGASLFRPPDGHEIMFTRESEVRQGIGLGIDLGGLWVLDLNGDGVPRLIIDNPEPENRDFRVARWSPDGTLIAFPATIGDGELYRIHVANSDGSGIRRISYGEGIWVESDLRWTPDGSMIAFNRWRKDPSNGGWSVQPVGIIDVRSGTTREAKIVGSKDGTLFDWSPDGTAIVGVPGALAGHGSAATAKPTLIDSASGAATDFSWMVRTQVSWQRIAR